MKHSARREWRFQLQKGLKWQNQKESSQKVRENPAGKVLNWLVSEQGEKKQQLQEQGRNQDELNQLKRLEAEHRGLQTLQGMQKLAERAKK
jgi:hypothetical protein